MKTTKLNYPKDVKQLLKILTYKRPHGSESELAFTEEFIVPHDPQVFVGKSGDVLAYAVTTDPTSKVMFTAHVDTVHRTDGSQLIAYDPEMQLIYKSQNPDTKDTECLGADDGAGCWLMLQMIESGVPGTYMFFRGEERGGIGSSAMAAQYPEFFTGFDVAVAFDRRGGTDVITHQARGRCCSDTFARSLANALNDTHMELSYKPCDSGIFTDTANLTGLIPECTNLSCGYDSEHTNNETLDVDHLVKLRDACLLVHWDALPVERDPTDLDFDDPWDRMYSRRFSSPADDVIQMTFGQCVAWVNKTSSEDIAEVISELVDRLYAAEDAAYYGAGPADDDDEEPLAAWR